MSEIKSPAPILSAGPCVTWKCDAGSYFQDGDDPVVECKSKSSSSESGDLGSLSEHNMDDEYLTGSLLEHLIHRTDLLVSMAGAMNGKVLNHSCDSCKFKLEKRSMDSFKVAKELQRLVHEELSKTLETFLHNPNQNDQDVGLVKMEREAHLGRKCRNYETQIAVLNNRLVEERNRNSVYKKEMEILRTELAKSEERNRSQQQEQRWMTRIDRDDLYVKRELSEEQRHRANLELQELRLKLRDQTNRSKQQYSELEAEISQLKKQLAQEKTRRIGFEKQYKRSEQAMDAMKNVMKDLYKSRNKALQHRPKLHEIQNEVVRRGKQVDELQSLYEQDLDKIAQFHALECNHYKQEIAQLKETIHQLSY